MNSSVNISNFLPYQDDIIEMFLKKYLLKCKTEGGDWELAELGHLLNTMVHHGISEKSFEKLAQVLRPKTVDDVKKKYNELLEILIQSKEYIPEKWLDTTSKVDFLNETAKDDLSSNVPNFTRLQSIIPVSGKITQGKREASDAFPFIMEKITKEDVEDFDVEDESIVKDSCSEEQKVNFTEINKQISNLLKGNRSNLLSPVDVAVFTSAIDEVISLVDEIGEDEINKIRLQLLRNIQNKTILPLEEFSEENVANICINFFQLSNEYLDHFDIDNLITKLLKDD